MAIVQAVDTGRHTTYADAYAHAADAIESFGDAVSLLSGIGAMVHD